MSATQQSQDPSRPRRLLVLDDEPSICEFVRRVAETTGFEVKTTVTELVKDIAFLRVQLEPLAERRAESPIVAPRKIFLNMNRGSRRIVIEMTFVDFRKWT